MPFLVTSIDVYAEVRTSSFGSRFCTSFVILTLRGVFFFPRFLQAQSFFAEDRDNILP